MHLKRTVLETSKLCDQETSENVSSFDSLLAKVMLTESFDDVTTGSLVGFDQSGEPLVTFHGCPVSNIIARTCVSLNKEQIGRDVVLLFSKGDRFQPIVIGVILARQPIASQHSENQTVLENELGPIEVDGEHVLLSAGKEIVLRCGEASITLTHAGKIIIRGTYLSSRSEGVVRIKGGSVEIN